jgi:hypothetical protein
MSKVAADAPFPRGAREPAPRARFAIEPTLNEQPPAPFQRSQNERGRAAALRATRSSSAFAPRRPVCAAYVARCSRRSEWTPRSQATAASSGARQWIADLLQGFAFGVDAPAALHRRRRQHRQRRRDISEEDVPTRSGADQRAEQPGRDDAADSGSGGIEDGDREGASLQRKDLTRCDRPSSPRRRRRKRSRSVRRFASRSKDSCSQTSTLVAINSRRRKFDSQAPTPRRRSSKHSAVQPCCLGMSGWRMNSMTSATARVAP